MFCRRKNALTEGLRDVTAAENAFFAYCDGGEKAHLGLAEDGSKTVILGPVVAV